jgi:methyl-accepting chemotaxis protein
VVKELYVVVYRPVLDANKQVIGMLYVGPPINSVASVRKSMLETKVGKTGYVYILGGAGTP